MESVTAESAEKVRGAWVERGIRGLRSSLERTSAGSERRNVQEERQGAVDLPGWVRLVHVHDRGAEGLALRFWNVSNERRSRRIDVFSRECVGVGMSRLVSAVISKRHLAQLSGVTCDHIEISFDRFPGGRSQRRSRPRQDRRQARTDTFAACAEL